MKINRIKATWLHIANSTGHRRRWGKFDSSLVTQAEPKVFSIPLAEVLSNKKLGYDILKKQLNVINHQ
jgi:hypothetical protein